MKSFASIIVVSLAVIALSVTVSAGGGKGGHGKGGMGKMWKKMKTCNGVDAKTEVMKETFEKCKDQAKSEGSNESGEEGEGGHGKKHKMWKKMHECAAKELGVMNEDGSYKMDGIKETLKKVYGDENGSKLGDALEKNCSDKITKKPEDKKEKMEMMKCAMTAYKETCGDKGGDDE